MVLKESLRTRTRINITAFYMMCQRMILDIRWRAHVSNAEVLHSFSDLFCQPLVASYVIDVYLCLLFSHVACLDPGVPAHDVLCLMVNTYEGRKPMASWRRPPGRPRNVWHSNVQEDANALLLSMLWRSEIARGHGAAQRSTRTTRR